MSRRNGLYIHLRQDGRIPGSRPGHELLLPLPLSDIRVQAERLLAHKDAANTLDEILAECSEEQAKEV
jgi:hypothetical protein